MIASSSVASNAATGLLNASVSLNAIFVALASGALSKRKNPAPGSLVVDGLNLTAMPAPSPAAPAAPCGPLAPAGPLAPVAPAPPVAPTGPRGLVHVIVQSLRTPGVGPISVTFKLSVAPLYEVTCPSIHVPGTPSMIAITY